MARQLVLMGSGETTPTMVEVHKRVFADLDTTDPRAVLLDTPYGFQENADEITRRTIDYFARSVGAHVTPVPLRDATTTTAAQLGAAAAAVEEADWVYAGPGSPTYLLDQWERANLPEVVRGRLARPGATVFASAAVCAVGARTVPVYEIYKVGQTPRWEPGFDLTAELGLPCVVIPHFDNAEGGTHDTRYCYLGERRLAMLEAELPDDHWVLGIDEHTAFVVDLDTQRGRVAGRGGVTVRVRGRHTVFPTGAELALYDLRSAAREDTVGTTSTTAASTASVSTTGGTTASTSASGGSVLLDEVATHESAFDAALDDGDALAAAGAVVALDETIHAWTADANQSDEMDRARRTLHRLVTRLARIAQAGLHEHRDLVAPLVEELLALRADARAARDFATGDRIRDRLADAGIEVRDTPGGADWDYDDPAEVTGH